MWYLIADKKQLICKREFKTVQVLVTHLSINYLGDDLLGFLFGFFDEKDSG